jgi:hypothetical protein
MPDMCQWPRVGHSIAFYGLISEWNLDLKIARFHFTLIRSVGYQYNKVTDLCLGFGVNVAGHFRLDAIARSNPRLIHVDLRRI